MPETYRERRERENWQDTRIDHPFSSLDGNYLEGQLPVDLIHTSSVRRLKGIRQLGFLADREPGTTINLHNRFSHTITVASIMQKILSGNGFSQENIELGVASAILHDIAMPAFGDATKLLDPQALDEETRWQEAANRKVLQILKANHISLDRVDAVIQNKGLLGRVLDIADRIVYTTKDLHVVELESHGRYFDSLPPLKPDAELTKEGRVGLYFYNHFISKMGDLYRSVSVNHDTQQVFLTDEEGLGWFLAMRAMLHAHIYLHPHNLGRDLIVQKMLQPFYQPQTDVFPNPDPSKLTPQKLRKMTDADLRDHIFKYRSPQQFAMYVDVTFPSWAPSYEKFANLVDVEKRRQELEQEDDVSVIGIRTIKGFNAGLNYLVDTQSGLASFAQVNPWLAERIQKLEEGTRATYLFYTKK